MFTLWPPGPLEQKVSIRRSFSLMTMSTSSASGKTATVAVDVWMRPLASVAITLALEHPDATVHAIDISAVALEIARTNAERLGATRVHFVLGSLLDAAPRPIDLLVSNPPYVAERDKPALSREVRDFEPAVALFGGDDGWREIRALLRAAPDALAPGGMFLMELGYGQSEQLQLEVSAVKGLELTEVAADLQGIERLAVIRRA